MTALASLHLTQNSQLGHKRCQRKSITAFIGFDTQGSKLKKMSGRKFATSYENLVATLKMLVAKLIEAI